MPSRSLMPHWHDHGPGHAGGLLDVAGRAAGDVARDASPRRCGRPSSRRSCPSSPCLPAVRARPSLGSDMVDPERLAARNDGDLVQRMGVLEQHVDQGVAGLVPGGDTSSPRRSSPGCGARGPSAPCRAPPPAPPCRRPSCWCGRPAAPPRSAGWPARRRNNPACRAR